MDRNNRGNTPLLAAAAEGNLGEVRALLATYTEQGTVLEHLEETSSYDGFTPLLWACMNSDTELVQILLNAGADPINPGETGTLYDSKTTPLALANYRGNDEIFELLLKARIQRNNVAAATPPYGRNYRRLVRKYTRRPSYVFGGGGLKKSSTRKKKHIDSYYHGRKDFKYYKKVKEVLNSLHFSSIIDIGCRKSPIMAGLRNNVYKAMLDIQEIPPMDGIHMIQADFYKWKPDRKYDVALCLQVLEHLDKPKEFAQKLLEVGKTVVISVPYKWKEGLCNYHTQDPVDESKIKRWLGREPDEQYIVNDKDRKRIICVYY